MAILGFKDKETAKIFHGLYSRRLPTEIQYTALRKLIYMDNASSLNDLRTPPANRLEMLTGNRKGQYSIRINNQYRICFTVHDNGFDDVEIVDYH